MFWENEYEPEVLGYNVSDEELQQFLNEKGIMFSIVDNSTRWCAFAQCYAHKHGFDVVKATSFSYMVSLFMTGMGISASTEMYFKEEKLELDLIDYMNKIKSEDTPEENQIKDMFNHIFEVYKENISDYEYATERLSFKLTPSEMEKFQSGEGKNNKEKFKILLDKNNGVKNMYSVKDDEYANELVKLGFSEKLLCSPESCKIWLEHCKKYNMKFLKGSYGTMVHKNFNKYFKKSKSNKIKEQLMCKGNDEIEIGFILDHINLFKSKVEEDVYILTSSPYNSLNSNLINNLKNYPYDVYVIHPNFLDYIAFVDGGAVGRLRPPLSEVNYAFTNASSEQMLSINQAIYGELNTFVFQLLSQSNKNI